MLTNRKTGNGTSEAVGVAEKVKHGSVKDLYTKKEATEKEFGIGVFEFTDTYSIFDYGRMPDLIPGKGEALARMSVYNFNELEKLGVKSHFRKFIEPDKIEVNLVRVLFPQKGEISRGEKNFLVPLEIIFRNSLPTGSSVFKRLESGQISPKDLGLSRMPKPGEKLAKPLMDVSTKLEVTDRYLSWKEAQDLAKVDDAMLEKIKKTALLINDFITKRAEKVGLEHADGKIEMAIDPHGELILVDVCGTLDENRMLFEGVHLSKQVIRDYYKPLTWYEELEKAKVDGVPKENWPKPPKMPPKLQGIVSNMYKSACEAWIGKKVWGAPSVSQSVNEYRKFAGK